MKFSIRNHKDQQTFEKIKIVKVNKRRSKILAKLFSDSWPAKYIYLNTITKILSIMHFLK